MKSKLLMGLYLAIVLLAVHNARADEFDTAARTYNVPVKVLRAIAQVESRGNMKALRKNNNGSYDFGILQINSIHWQTTCRHFNVATKQGNINCGAYLLSKHAKYAKADPLWAARYHSKTPSLKAAYNLKLKRAIASLN